MEVPVALFTFKRPEHTRQSLTALMQNVGFDENLLYVYCDGPRSDDEAEAVQATREVVSELTSGKAHITHQTRNRGLANSIIDGVNDLTQQFGSCVVVEDDLVTSPYFLEYMAQSLHKYSANANVMQVSGHMFPVEFRSAYDATFLPFVTSWGWGTWRRAWEKFDRSTDFLLQLAASRKLRNLFNLNGSYPYYRMLRMQRQGKLDSWAILWYTTVFRAQGLTLYPNRSLVKNIGFDGTGTHCGGESRNESLQDAAITKLPPVEIDSVVQDTIFRFLRKESSLWRKFRNRVLYRFQMSVCR